MQHTILQGVHKDDSTDGIWQIAIGSILISFFMATLYHKWSTGMHSLSQGFQFGALVGAMIGLGLGMIMYATSNFMDFLIPRLMQIFVLNFPYSKIILLYLPITNDIEPKKGVFPLVSFTIFHLTLSF